MEARKQTNKSTQVEVPNAINKSDSASASDSETS